MRPGTSIHRRGAIGAIAALTLAARPALAQVAPATRAIPSSGERIPVVGLGSWITFNVGRDRARRDNCIAVMKAFFDGGGRLIDSSPMYGSSQDVIGEGLKQLGRSGTVFAAEKVWTASGASGPGQIEATRRHWGLPRFDLLQVHNLLAWREHLATLQAMKAETAAQRLRYVGVTTSHGRRHGELESILKTEKLDFVQLTYNPLDREVEQRLLPLAQERGVAVIVNRPFQEGALLRTLQRHPLPAWAAELGCDAWAPLLLKFVLSHPAVTCVIPATTQVAHVRQNLAAGSGRLPDAAQRARIASHIQSL
jgi:diketogulonate reductase-like aldo/keto reductase